MLIHHLMLCGMQLNFRPSSPLLATRLEILELQLYLLEITGIAGSSLMVGPTTSY